MLEKEFLVENQHSAKKIGSGALEVLSTPSLIAFMENVAKDVAEEYTTSEETTVGIELNVQHLKATALGKKVQVTANLTEQKKAILSFDLEAHEGDVLVGKGTHKRAIVNIEKFMENV